MFIQSTTNTVKNIVFGRVSSPLERTAIPYYPADSYISSTDDARDDKSYILGKRNPFLDDLANKLKEKAKQVGQTVAEKVSNFDSKQAINEVKLTKLLVDNGSYSSYIEALKNKDEIKELAKLDYKEVEDKYLTIKRNLQSRGYNIKTTEYNEAMTARAVIPVLKYEKLTTQDINEIYRINDNRPKSHSNQLNLHGFAKTLENYENFESLSASSQTEMIDTQGYSFPTYCSLTMEEASELKKNYSSLCKFQYVKDLQSVSSKKEFVAILNERRKNIPCHAIPVDKDSIEKVTAQEGIENLKNALNNTDLTKYKEGFPLEYSRQDFIKDFNVLTKDLTAEDKKQVFDYFQFKIDSDNDIENYPNPNGNNNMTELNIDIDKYQKLVDKFMLNNRVKLEPEDKELEDALNNTIKAFPEFVSVMGKPQHRGDSIDYHTFDDMKRVMNDPRYAELETNEQRILMVATLFHDFGKAQNIIDDGHAQKSSLAAKEIIKKMNISFDDKERIFNLIKHSHWLVDGSGNDDIAFYFRRPNDFKMAEIFEKADSNSAGFEYNPDPAKITEIKNNIDKINSTGIPIFADSLPTDESKYDVNKYGVKYIDLRDPEASVEKYGYPKGTKVKDLKFICHGSPESPQNLSVLCDDSKDVCLSTRLLTCDSHFSTRYGGIYSYILSGNNANIVLGDKDTSCTGGKRGYDYAKNSMYQTMENLMTESGGYINHNRSRVAVSKQICADLDLTEEEYLELYTSICNLERLEDISDIELSTGKKLKAETIQKTISNIRDYMVEYVPHPDEYHDRFENEFVVYNPKIEAQVVRGDIDSYKQSDIPLVLV